MADWVVLDRGYNWCGLWSAFTEYAIGDAILYQDGDFIHAFVVTATHNIGQPPTNPTYFRRLFQTKWRDK